MCADGFFPIRFIAYIRCIAVIGAGLLFQLLHVQASQPLRNALQEKPASAAANSAAQCFENSKCAEKGIIPKKAIEKTCNWPNLKI